MFRAGRGEALIRHVVRALAAVPGLQEIRVSIEPAAAPAVARALADIDRRVRCIASADNLADSVYTAARDADGAVLVTTADNVLLTPHAIRRMLDAAQAGADGAVALATRGAVLAAHPQGQRNFYRFADDSYSNCNLYLLRGDKALRLVEAFRSGGQFRRNPLRLVVAFGPFTLLLMLLHRLSLAGAARRLSRRFRIDMRAIVLADGAHAIDVDNPRSRDIAETLLAARERVAA